MSSINAISPDKLVRLIGVPHCPALIDVRTDEEWESDPRFVPGAVRRPHASIAEWASEFAGRAAVVIDQKGDDLGEAVAAWLRHAGVDSADVLIGGHIAWAQSNGPLVPAAKLPTRDALGRTVWVTRARPKVDRIACPWLIWIDSLSVWISRSNFSISLITLPALRCLDPFWGYSEFATGSSSTSALGPSFVARLPSAVGIVSLRIARVTNPLFPAKQTYRS
ncbi:rhodanese-like domain-containing protein [Methylocystis hirsuta]|uniref:rhodanese-like domain-containing protein n=1 Tax=Methylocystis hirsuta TaxID=369798 RepID=UPI001FE053EA|nr:rhodanese-like domain-containing protein [Methylocystis hirsuta]